MEQRKSPPSSGVGTLAGLRQGAVSDPAPRETMAQAPR